MASREIEALAHAAAAQYGAGGYEELKSARAASAAAVEALLERAPGDTRLAKWAMLAGEICALPFGYSQGVAREAERILREDVIDWSEADAVLRRLGIRADGQDWGARGRGSVGQPWFSEQR